jgi:CheY-like chemotaxis protein
LPRGRYRVSIETNGEKGFERAIELKPDVVVLDLMMPVMDGYEFLDRMHAYPDTADIPVVVLTSTILTGADRARLGSVSRIMSKSDLATSSLIDAIAQAQHTAAPIDVA